MVELRWTELMEGAVAAWISANKAVLCLSLIRVTVLLRSLSLAGRGGEGERGCRSGAGGLEAGPGSSLVLALWCGARWLSPALAAVLPWWMTVVLALEVGGQLNKHLLCCRCRRGGLAFPCLFLAGLGGEGAEVGEGVAACVRVRRCPASPAGRGGRGRCGSVLLFWCVCSGGPFLRGDPGRPWRRGVVAPGGGVPEWRDVEAAAVGFCGLQVGDLAISSEVEWRWPQVRGGRSLGCVPGRWTFAVLRSSSSELVDIATHQRFRARSSSASWVSAPGGGSFRRLRRWRPHALGELEVEDGVRQQWCSLYLLCFFCACIWLCTGFLLV